MVHTINFVLTWYQHNRYDAYSNVKSFKLAIQIVGLGYSFNQIKKWPCICNICMLHIKNV